MNPLSSPSRRELACVLVLTLFGAVVRLWSLGQLGLTHFDEGIYALSGLWEQTSRGLGALDPMVIPYAPPGLPLLIGLSYAMFGVADSSAIFASLACGILTVPAAGWVARRTFGPGAGAAAAALAAASLVHVAFSRHALTDAPFVLAWVVAIGVGGWFLEQPKLPRAAVLGLAVAAAQYLKYNGWLAGIVVALAAVLGAIGSPSERGSRRILTTFGWGLFAATLAAALYWPWFQFVESHGGYGALTRHHRSYLGGQGSWIPFWSQQLAQNVALSWSAGWRAGFAIAALLAAWVAMPMRPGTALNRPLALALAVGLFATGSAAALLANLPWWVGLAWCYWLLIDARPAVRMTGVWWLLLSALTPLYHPYARLWLPLHAVGWILLGGVAASAIAWLRAHTQDRGTDLVMKIAKDRRITLGGLVVVLCLVGGVFQETRAGARPFPVAWFFEPTTGLRSAVSSLPRDLPGPPAPSVRVLARRPVAFYLLVYAGTPFVLESSLQSLSEARVGEHALVDDAVVDAGVEPMASLNSESRNDGAWHLQSEWHLVLDPVTLLDTRPSAVEQGARDRAVRLRHLVRKGRPQNQTQSDGR